MSDSEYRLTRWRTMAYGAWAIIGVLVLLAAAGYVLGRISSALAPFIVAFLIVFMLQGLVAYFERRGMSRSRAVLLCFGVAAVVLGVAVIFIVPVVASQLVDFASQVPRYAQQGQVLLDFLRAQYSELVVPDWLREAALSIAQSTSQVFVRVGNSLGKGILSAGSGIATVFFDLFLGVVIAFWTLKDLPTIRRELKHLAGERYGADFENLISTLTRVVGGYLRGTTIASLLTGTLATIGLAIIGVPYALVLGIITFVFNYVPYVGPFLSGLIAATVALFVGWPQALGAIAIVVGAQQLVDLFVTPRVMSEQVDLHPTLVIFSLLVGGGLVGFWGMVFAIPVAAVAKGLFVYYWERRTDRPLATEDGALFRTPQCDEQGEECEDEPPSLEDPSSDKGART